MPPSSFVLEKHLEDYICRKWETTIFGGDFNIYENGRQYQTNTGPLDILAARGQIGLRVKLKDGSLVNALDAYKEKDDF